MNQSNYNLYFYAFPGYGNADDIAGYIAAPGRFYRDATTAKANGESARPRSEQLRGAEVQNRR